MQPWLYFRLARWWSQSEHLLVTADTDICIEGYPRSANSFAVGAFEAAQSKEVVIGHHTHVAASLIRACKLRLPVILLIRAPGPAIISRQAFILENDVRAGISPPSAPIPLIQHLKSWLSFYRAARPYVDQCVVAPFPLVTEDFGVIIQQVNEKFGQCFDGFEHTAVNVEDIGKERGPHTLPNELRNELKERVRSNFDKMAKSRPGQKLVQEAEELYDWYKRKNSYMKNVD